MGAFAVSEFGVLVGFEHKCRVTKSTGYCKQDSGRSNLDAIGIGHLEIGVTGGLVAGWGLGEGGGEKGGE